MRLLWVAPTLGGRGGIGRVLVGGSRALAERGHEVHLAGYAAGAVPEAPEGVRVHRLPRDRPRIARLPSLLGLVQAALWVLLLWGASALLAWLSYRTLQDRAGGLVLGLAAALVLLSLFDVYVTPISSSGRYSNLAGLFD